MKTKQTVRVIGPDEKPDAHSWPRHTVESIDCRKRDIVIRIADWTRDKDEPSFDVEVYFRGVYDWNESETFTTKTANRTRREAKKLALEFANEKINKFIEFL